LIVGGVSRIGVGLRSSNGGFEKHADYRTLVCDKRTLWGFALGNKSKDGSVPLRETAHVVLRRWRRSVCVSWVLEWGVRLRVK
jgi:hypothetical protein